ncbi:hypothetical protein HDU92_005559 [Lobulomyces angularis]|nr:hypothetical protein HDU92_005559 [Lobulomyces angularis]
MVEIIGRILNERGKRERDRVSSVLCGFFVFFAIIYANYRSKVYYTQLPATFTTTVEPRLLFKSPFFSKFFTTIPSKDFEFPAITVCPLDNFASIKFETCNYCHDSGIVYHTENLGMFGKGLQCISLNEEPAPQIKVSNSSDSLDFTLSVHGGKEGGSAGVIVLVHPRQMTDSGMYLSTVSPTNTFSVNLNTVNLITILKEWKVKFNGSAEQDYQAKGNSLNIYKLNNTALNSNNIVKFSAKFSDFTVLYEKEFNTLNVIHRFVMFFTLLLLNKKNSYSENLLAKANRDEGFDRFN